MNTTDVTTTNWKERCEEISKEEFWDESCAFPPIKRMGFSDGPGASLGGEPWSHRTCTITGQRTNTRNAHFVVKDAGEPRYYRVNDPITLEEFKALCEVIIPGVGPCSMGYGRDL